MTYQAFKLSARSLAILLVAGLCYSSSAVPAMAAEKVVQFWTLMTQPERIAGMERVIAHFEKANPGITIELSSTGIR